jgi:hypothetical protein
MASAPCHQTAHAVRDDHHLVEGHGPRCDQPFEQPGELAPVRRDVQPAVVVEVDRGEPEIARERRTVVVSLPSPLPIVPAGPVHQDDQLAGGLREGQPQRLPLELQGMAPVAQPHLDGERIADFGQVVAEHSIERGDHRLALQPGRALGEQGREQPR